VEHGINAIENAGKLLDLAGIRINGTRRFDMQIHNERLFQRVIA
jgi:hypothetical protein